MFERKPVKNPREYDRTHLTGEDGKKNRKIKCECGAEVSKQSMPAHLKSSKHKRMLEISKSPPFFTNTEQYYSVNIIMD